MTNITIDNISLENNTNNIHKILRCLNDIIEMLLFCNTYIINIVIF